MEEEKCYPVQLNVIKIVPYLAIAALGKGKMYGP